MEDILVDDDVCNTIEDGKSTFFKDRQIRYLAMDLMDKK